MGRPYQPTPAGRVFGMGLPSWLRSGENRMLMSPSEIEREDMIDAENIQRMQQQDALADYQRERQAIATEDAAEAFAEQNPDQLGSLVTKFPGLIRSKNFGNFARVADAAQAQTKAAQSLIPNLRMKMTPEERAHFDAELGKSPQNYMGAYERAQTNVERDKQHGELVKAGVPIESIDRTKLYSPFEAASLVQQAAQRKAQINHEQEFDKTMYKLMGEGKFAEMSRAAQLHQDSGHPVGKWAKYADMEPASEVDTLALSRQVGAIDRQINNLQEQRLATLDEIENAPLEEVPALKSKLEKIDAALEERQKFQGEVIRKFDNRTATSARSRRGELPPTASNISQPSMLNYAEGSHPQEAQESIAGASGFGALPEQGTLAQAMAPNVIRGNAPKMAESMKSSPPRIRSSEEPDTNYQKELEKHRAENTPEKYIKDLEAELAAPAPKGMLPIEHARQRKLIADKLDEARNNLELNEVAQSHVAPIYNDEKRELDTIVEEYAKEMKYPVEDVWRAIATNSPLPALNQNVSIDEGSPYELDSASGMAIGLPSVVLLGNKSEEVNPKFYKALKTLREAHSKKAPIYTFFRSLGREFTPPTKAQILADYAKEKAKQLPAESSSGSVAPPPLKPGESMSAPGGGVIRRNNNTSQNK